VHVRAGFENNLSTFDLGRISFSVHVVLLGFCIMHAPGVGLLGSYIAPKAKGIDTIDGSEQCASDPFVLQQLQGLRTPASCM